MMRNFREHMAFMSPPEMTTKEKRKSLLSERAEVATGDPARMVPVGTSRNDKEVPARVRLAQIDAGLANLDLKESVE